MYRGGRWALFGDGRGQMWEWDLHTSSSKINVLANFMPVDAAIECLNTVCQDAGLVRHHIGTAQDARKLHAGVI